MLDGASCGSAFHVEREIPLDWHIAASLPHFRAVLLGEQVREVAPLPALSVGVLLTAPGEGSGLLDGQVLHAKEALVIGPDVLHLQSRRCGELGEIIQSILVRAFSENAVALLEGELLIT